MVADEHSAPAGADGQQVSCAATTSVACSLPSLAMVTAQHIKTLPLLVHPAEQQHRHHPHRSRDDHSTNVSTQMLLKKLCIAPQASLALAACPLVHHKTVDYDPCCAYQPMLLKVLHAAVAE